MDINTIFEQPFDYDSYIEDWLLTIDDVNERTFARKHLAVALRTMIRESEKSYKRLEDRVYAEVPAKGDRHYIYMTVVKKSQFDITNGSWFPLVKDDERPRKKITLSSQTQNVLDCLFYHGNGEDRDTIATHTPLPGTVNTASGEYSSIFMLLPTHKYKDVVEHMYDLFGTNGLIWLTQNCAYILRFFDVVVIETAAPNGEEVLDYAFESELSDMQKDHIPVWNVQSISYDSNFFSAPIIDAVYFEHSFPLKEFGAQNGYLIESNSDILSVRNTSDEIVVITAKDSFNKWSAYKIVHDPPLHMYCFDLPVLHNSAKDTFVGRFISQSGVLMQSRLEMFRQVEQFDLMDIIHLEDVSLQTDYESFDDTHMSLMNASSENISDERYMKLVDLNWFITDDYVNRNEQKVIVFKFSAHSKNFLSTDLISFIISHMQRQFNEYRCEAVLEIQGEL